MIADIFVIDEHLNYHAACDALKAFSYYRMMILYSDNAFYAMIIAEERTLKPYSSSVEIQVQYLDEKNLFIKDVVMQIA